MNKTGESIFPLPLDKRTEGAWSLFWLWAGGSVLLTTFLVASGYAPSIGLIPTIVLTVFTNFAAYTVVSWSSQRSAKYGIDEIIALRPTFGIKGSLFGVIILVGINFGWMGIMAAMTGSATKQLVNTISGGVTFTGDYSLYAFLGLAIPIILLMLSPKNGFRLAKLTVPLLIILAIYLLVNLLQPHYWNQMMNVKPTYDIGWAFVLEALVAFAVAWQPYLGAWNKFASSQRRAFWSTYIGLMSVGILLGLVGGMATLLTGEIDPSVWATELGMGLSGLIVILLGTITSIALLLYAGIMAVLSVFPKWNYNIVAISISLPSTIFIYVSSLQNFFDLILVFVGLLAGPYWAVAMADYFFLRKEKISVKDCYYSKGKYTYWKGYNPIAFIAHIFGMLLWVYLGGWLSGLDSVSFASGHAIFQYITATIPSMVFSGILYIILAKYFFSKYPYGGYTFNPKEKKVA
ncbi:purine-cytosine permease family protein [Virgibacillus sp. W0181]|uniref:purine-cytosine permease family protein n=1 Tax=Virgibacillus sp. W0181 TaxID=3391581 RepID=UPI003F472EDC